MFSDISLFSFEDCLAGVDKVPVVTIKESYDANLLYTFAIPTYCRTETLHQTLNSILEQQTEIRFNILISDNNSERNDSTELFLKSNYWELSNLSYYKNTQNVMPYGNWNRLFLLCKTKYLVLIHDDDVLHPNYLKEMDKVLQRFPAAASINAKQINWDGGKYNWPDYKVKYRVISNNAYTNFAFFSSQAPSGCLYNVKDMRESGGFNGILPYSYDYLNVFTMCLQGKVLLNYDKPLVQYRVVHNMSSELKVQKSQIDEDLHLRLQVAEKLGLPKWYVNFVIWLKTKSRLRNINIRHSLPEYKGYTPGGSMFMIIYKLFEWGYMKIWVNRMHCIGRL